MLTRAEISNLRLERAVYRRAAERALEILGAPRATYCESVELKELRAANGRAAKVLLKALR